MRRGACLEFSGREPIRTNTSALVAVELRRKAQPDEGTLPSPDLLPAGAARHLDRRQWRPKSPSLGASASFIWDGIRDFARPTVILMIIGAALLTFTTLATAPRKTPSVLVRSFAKCRRCQGLFRLRDARAKHSASSSATIPCASMPTTMASPVRAIRNQPLVGPGVVGRRPAARDLGVRALTRGQVLQAQRNAEARWQAVVTTAEQGPGQTSQGVLPREIR